MLDYIIVYKNIKHFRFIPIVIEGPCQQEGRVLIKKKVYLIDLSPIHLSNDSLVQVY